MCLINNILKFHAIGRDIIKLYNKKCALAEALNVH